jgi:hypothetical protein
MRRFGKRVGRHRNIIAFLCIAAFLPACSSGPFKQQVAGPTSLAEVPAVRLNFRYEADVPGPDEAAKPQEERNAAVQSDFDQTRPQEILDRTLPSPDKKRVLAIYHQATDVPAEFRLDMYTPDGKLLHKITPDTMAVHFPDTIVWAPDSSAVAFVAMVRAAGGDAETAPTNPAVATPSPLANANAAVEANTQDVPAEEANAATPAAPTPASPTGVLTFRTEQIYICDAQGEGTKPVTQNEGLIYFYYVWSPDSSMLAALAATAREWQYLSYQADTKGEVFTPVGRPRIVEKNGRERRLDDALTPVYPVWSPDSSKVAEAFETQVRVYDAKGNNPTQAAIPLRNQLLLSSQAYDRDQQQKLQSANGAAPSEQAPAENQPNTLPDEKSLVSFNPITDLEWTAPDILYFRTAFIKRMKNEADSVQSFARWHRLVFSVQPPASNQ